MRSRLHVACASGLLLALFLASPVRADPEDQAFPKGTEVFYCRTDFDWWKGTQVISKLVVWPPSYHGGIPLDALTNIYMEKRFGNANYSSLRDCYYAQQYGNWGVIETKELRKFIERYESDLKRAEEVFSLKDVDQAEGRGRIANAYETTVAELKAIAGAGPTPASVKPAAAKPAAAKPVAEPTLVIEKTQPSEAERARAAAAEAAVAETQARAQVQALSQSQAEWIAKMRERDAAMAKAAEEVRQARAKLRAKWKPGPASSQ